MRALAFSALLLTGTTLTLPAQVAPVGPPEPPAGPLVLLTDLAFDGRGNVLRGARIGVNSGRITSVDTALRVGDGAGATIDLRGLTVMPGWIDTHVHLDSHWDGSGRIATEAEPPLEASLGIALAGWETLMGGFTTVQTVGDPTEAPLRDMIRDRGFPGPRVLTSLAWIEGKGDSTGSPEQLRALVRTRKSEGADLVKIFASTSRASARARR